MKPQPWDTDGLNELMLTMQRQGWRGMVRTFSDGHGSWAEFSQGPACAQQSGVSPLEAAQKAAKVALEKKGAKP